jgi:hypothetical protein
MACCKSPQNMMRSLTSFSKKTYSYQKNKIRPSQDTSGEADKFKELQRKIHALPEEIRLYIVSYLTRPQPQYLLRDIRNFYQTYCFMLNVICLNDRSILVDRMLSFYDIGMFYKNINPIVKKNIKKWQLRQRHTEVIDDFTIIEYPNVLTLFSDSNKWIFLWGALPQYHRNKYINFLYSTIESESDEDEAIHIPINIPIGIYIGLPTSMTI